GFFCLSRARRLSYFPPPSRARYLGVAGFRVAQSANISGLWMLAAPAAPQPSRFDFPDLVKYHTDLMSYYDRLLENMRAAMLRKLANRRLACYGAGRDFGYFLSVFRDLGVQPLAVAADAAEREPLGIPCIRPSRLSDLKPDLCLVTSFDYEEEIAPRARKSLPASTELLTLTQLIYELDISVPILCDYRFEAATSQSSSPVSAAAA